MRRTAALIAGAGPAGTAAAIALARAGAQPLLIERQRETGDALCGGFLSWRTVDRLAGLGLDPAALGGTIVRSVRLFAGGRSATSDLPAPAIGVSRYRLDSALLAEARRAGAAVEQGCTIREASATSLRLADGGTIEGDSLFLATGKHELRGHGRDTRADADPWLGLRIRLPAGPRLERLVGDAVELHLFDRGYAGLVRQEDGGGNLCLALHKSLLAETGGSPASLFAWLAAELPELGERIADASTAQPDAIAAVPYGWRAQSSQPGVFRLGDQAAVIPSLAGEGIDIALASGTAAAAAWARGGAAAAVSFQRGFAASMHRPLAIAEWLKRLCERPMLAVPGVALLEALPALAGVFARATRLAA